MDDLRDMVHFVTLAREGSFTRAAASLGMPNSTLSRRISALEKFLGSPLFTRTTRRVELTEAGRFYRARCEQIVEEAKSAREELQELAQRPKGLLRISMSPDFGTTFMAPIIAEFSKKYPDIHLQLDLSPRRVDLVGEGYDVAVRIGMPVSQTLIVRKLVLARRGLFASPAFLKSHRAFKAPADLADAQCLIVDHSDNTNTWVLRCGGKVEEVTVKGNIMANNPGMVLQLAVESAGIAAIDEIMASSYLKSGRLQRVLPKWSISSVPIFALTASRSLPLRTRLFIDHLTRRLKAFDRD